VPGADEDEAVVALDPDCFDELQPAATMANAKAPTTMALMRK
jgi:hypothetical protein